MTSGPKNYAYNLQKPNKKGQTSICEVRGITLNFKNASNINFNTVFDMVTGKSGIKLNSVSDENKIVRNPSTGHIIIKCEVKDYRIILTNMLLLINILQSHMDTELVLEFHI